MPLLTSRPSIRPEIIHWYSKLILQVLLINVDKIHKILILAYEFLECFIDSLAVFFNEISIKNSLKKLKP